MVDVFSNVVEMCTNYLLLLFFFFPGKIMVFLRRSQMKIRPTCIYVFKNVMIFNGLYEDLELVPNHSCGKKSI